MSGSHLPATGGGGRRKHGRAPSAPIAADLAVATAAPDVFPIESAEQWLPARSHHRKTPPVLRAFFIVADAWRKTVRRRAGNQGPAAAIDALTI